MEEAPRRSAPPRNDAVISQERFERYHRFAREKGTSRVLYYIARAILMPAFLVWFRLQRSGREHARFKGGLIVASNHRSFLDPFVIGALLPWRRRMQFVAKVELFEKRWQGWVLSRLGAFPIRRGQSDETAMETAGLIVDRGGTVVIFPEGTRIRTGSLGRPKRGVGRLALETGAAGPPGRRPGFRGGSPRLADPPAQGPPAGRQAADLPAHRAPLAGARGDRHRPDLAEHRAAVGVAGRPAAAAQGGRDRRRQLGHRGRRPARPRRARGRARHPDRGEGASRSTATARTTSTCRELKLPDGLAVKRATEIELAGCDLICLAVPSSSLPNVVGSLADRIGSRASVLLLSKGFVQPMGALPERVRVRARPRPGARLPRRPRARARGGRRDGRPGARQRRPGPAGDARRGLRPRRPGLRAHRRRHRGRGRRGVEERRRARRRGRRALRPQRRRDRRRRRLARVRRVRARARRPSRDLHRASPASAT